MKNKWIKETSWLNDQFLSQDIRALVVSFHGLGSGVRNEFAYDLEIELGKNGVLLVHPYYGPWSWFNRAARTFVDQLLDAVYKEFELEENVPLVCSGGSMGGCSSLLYARYGKRKPVACEALFPVCDTEAHFHERPDLPASFNFAFRGYEGTMEEHLSEHSPLARAKEMPDIPYQIIHGDSDKSVNKEIHSDRFVAAMRELGRKVDYYEIPGMGHGTNIPFEVPRLRCDFILRNLGLK